MILRNIFVSFSLQRCRTRATLFPSMDVRKHSVEYEFQACGGQLVANMSAQSPRSGHSSVARMGWLALTRRGGRGYKGAFQI